jgi:hypothetical protein
MADCVETRDSSLQVLPLIKNKISEYICKKCSAYESQLKEALEELESARTIINILQKELLTTTTTKNTCGRDCVPAQGALKQTNIKEWTTVSSRHNSTKPSKNNLCEHTPTDQHIVTMNRFTPLYNLQANNTESNGLQALQEQRKQAE